jgi:hypothetical protein
MVGGDRADVERLRAYWDGVVQGDPTAPDHLDPGTAAVVRQLHALYRPPLPDPAFHDRLQEDLMHSATVPSRIAAPWSAGPIATSPNGRSAPGSTRLLQRRPPAAPGRMLSYLASAALVVVTLVATYLAFGPSRPGEAPTAPSANLPMLLAPATPAPTEEPIIAWTIPADALPAGDVEAVFYRLTLPPGTSLPLLAGPFCGCGAETVKTGIGIEIVEDGTYALRLEAPLTVVRAGAEDAVAAGTEVTLGPGDVARFPDYAAPGEIRNAGADPVSVVGLAILSEESTGTPVPDIAPGVRAEGLSRAIATDWSKLPPGPILVTLRRLSLSAGAELTPSEPGGLETIHVEEGQVSLSFMRAGETEPSPPIVLRPRSPAAFYSVQPGGRRMVRNDREQTATILVLTIAAAGEGSGTPALDPSQP